MPLPIKIMLEIAGLTSGSGKGKEKERGSISLVDESLSSDDHTEVCVAEWVDMPKGNCNTPVAL
jgi:hypothetical protein